MGNINIGEWSKNSLVNIGNIGIIGNLANRRSCYILFIYTNLRKIKLIFSKKRFFEADLIKEFSNIDFTNFSEKYYFLSILDKITSKDAEFRIA